MMKASRINPAAALLLLFATLQPASAQVTLEQCMDLARKNYPQIRQLNLIEAAAEYDIAAAMKSWLPRLTVSGKASYQSDVVEMPFDIPGFTFDLPHDQYSLVGEIDQTIWDGGTSGSQKDVAVSEALVQKEQVEVSLYSINERVEKLYLGILLYDGQLRQNDILLKSLERNASQARARIENGTASRSDLEMIEVNILNCEQQREELEKDRATYVSMLERFTGESLAEQEFIVPDENADSMVKDDIRRPELGLYDAQLRQQEAKVRQLNSKIAPKFTLALQGGVGRPGLNILENSFQPYWTAGIRMSWDIGALYTRKDEKRQLDAQKRKIESDRETFLFNTNLQIQEQVAEIRRYFRMVEDDEKIVGLREDIRRSTEAAVENGTKSASDLLLDVNKESMARKQLIMHQIEMMKALYELKTIKNS